MFDLGLFIIDVTALGRRGKGFRDNYTKAFVLKKYDEGMGSNKLDDFINEETLLWTLAMSYLDHFVNVTFGSSEFGGILDFDENDEVKVMPHVMFRPRVLLKRHVLVVKCFTLQTCKNRQTYIMSGFVDEEVLQGTS